MYDYTYKKDEKPLLDKILNEFSEAYWRVHNLVDFHSQTELTYEDAKKDAELVKKLVNKVAQRLEAAKPNFRDYITGIITSKHKFQPIDFEYSKVYEGWVIKKLQQFYKITNDVNKNTFFKGQFAHGILLENGEIYLLNFQPRKYCCNLMKRQFSVCSNHGLNCPDYFIKYNGRYFLEANGNYAIDHCPFCGKKIGDYSGKFINLC